MSYQWNCPLCEPAIGHFERITKTGIEMVMAAHILRHEEEAGLRAVNNARLKCAEINCSLGKTRCLNTETGLFEPKLTEYDIKLLQGMKIKV